MNHHHESQYDGNVEIIIFSSTNFKILNHKIKLIVLRDISRCSILSQFPFRLNNCMKHDYKAPVTSPVR